MDKKYWYSYFKAVQGGTDCLFDNITGCCNSAKEVKEIYEGIKDDGTVKDFSVEVTYHVESPLDYEMSKL